MYDAINLVHFFGPWLPLLLLWSFFWKSLALWHAAQKGRPWWFLLFLVFNTAGILEIIYLFFVEKMKWKTLFSNAKAPAAPKQSDE